MASSNRVFSSASTREASGTNEAKLKEIEELGILAKKCNIGNASEIEEIYLPTTTVINKSGTKREKPLFPGYIFVKVEMTDES